MITHFITFVLGMFVAQEYQVPNVRKAAEDIIKVFKK